MKRVNIELPDEIHTQAKLLSVLSKKTLNNYLAEAIISAVKKDRQKLKKLLQ